MSIAPTLYRALADAWAACNASLLNLGLGVKTYLQKITFTSFAELKVSGRPFEGFNGQRCCQSLSEDRDGLLGVLRTHRPQGGLLNKIYPLPVAQDFNGPNQSGDTTRRYNANAVVFLTSSITAYVRVSRTPGSCHSTVPANSR